MVFKYGGKVLEEEIVYGGWGSLGGIFGNKIQGGVIFKCVCHWFKIMSNFY